MGNCVACALVGTLWGLSNPFVKLGGETAAVPDVVFHPPFIHELKDPWRTLCFKLHNTLQTKIIPYILHPPFLIPFIMNITGSILFLRLLATVPISLAAPLSGVTNFLCTAIVETKVMKKTITKQEMLGSTLVVTGAIWALTGTKTSST